MNKIIDTSGYNGVVNWKSAKTQGISGAILKIIRRNLDRDKQFNNSYMECEKNKINWGVYNYSYATTPSKAKSDMTLICNILDKIKDKKYFTLGVWFDIEDDLHKKLSRSQIVEILNTAKEVVEERGYPFGIYTGYSFFNELIDVDRIMCKRYWIARYYRAKEEMSIKVSPIQSYKPKIEDLYAWQYTESGIFSPAISNGNNKRVDLNIVYGNINLFEDKENRKDEKPMEKEKCTPDKAVVIAHREKGYIEKKSNKDLDSKTANAGRNNYTKYGRWFGLNGEYWCAIYICWIMVMAYGVDKAKELMCGTLSAACETIRSNFKKKKQYIEAGKNVRPQVGDFVFFKGTRHSGANHIALVIEVLEKGFRTSEGNTSSDKGVVDNGGSVNEKYYEFGYAKLLGYGRPKYDSNVTTLKSNITTKTTTVPKTTTKKSGYNKTKKFSGIVNVSELNVRTGAGTENKTCSFSPLKKGTIVDICDTEKAKNGKTWYYIRYKNKYGFMSAKYITKMSN